MKVVAVCCSVLQCVAVCSYITLHNTHAYVYVATNDLLSCYVATYTYACVFVHVCMCMCMCMFLCVCASICLCAYVSHYPFRAHNRSALIS